MIISKEYNELIDDLINNRLLSLDNNESHDIARALLRYGFDGYLNCSKDKLIKEAINIELYGPDIDGIELK